MISIAKTYFLIYNIAEGGADLKERLKELRLYLQLSQKEFGEKIFVTQNHVSSLESGRKTLTDRTIKDICSIFGVNEEWFRTGKGEMMIDLVGELDGVDDESKDILRKINELNKDDRSALIKILDRLSSK